jgi:hypothetical protein
LGSEGVVGVEVKVEVGVEVRVVVFVSAGVIWDTQATRSARMAAIAPQMLSSRKSSMIRTAEMLLECSLRLIVAAPAV